MARTPGTRPVEAMNQLDVRLRKLEEKIKQHEAGLVVISTQQRKTAIVQVAATVLLTAAILMTTLL